MKVLQDVLSFQSFSHLVNNHLVNFEGGAESWVFHCSISSAHKGRKLQFHPLSYLWKCCRDAEQQFSLEKQSLMLLGPHSHQGSHNWMHTAKDISFLLLLNRRPNSSPKKPRSNKNWKEPSAESLLSIFQSVPAVKSGIFFNSFLLSFQNKVKGVYVCHAESLRFHASWQYFSQKKYMI